MENVQYVPEIVKNVPIWYIFGRTHKYMKKQSVVLYDEILRCVPICKILSRTHKLK